MPFTVSPFQGLWCYCYQITFSFQCFDKNPPKEEETAVGEKDKNC